MMTPNEKYQHDPEFHALVNFLAMLQDGPHGFRQSELLDAYRLAEAINAVRSHKHCGCCLNGGCCICDPLPIIERESQ
jgi:hypothetical protein